MIEYTSSQMSSITFYLRSAIYYTVYGILTGYQYSVNSNLQGENEKEKASEGTTATPTSSATSQPQSPTTESNSMASPQMGASPMGMPPQYYASYQSAYPYYATGYPMYNMMNANPLAAQGYQNTAAPSTVLPNQTDTVPLPANQNAGDNTAARSVRQRTAVNHSTVGQNTPQPAGNVSQTNNSVVQTQPRITQSSMASLIVLWVLAVSIIALVCRRLFMIS